MNAITPIAAAVVAELHLYDMIGPGGITAQSVADALKPYAGARQINVRINSIGGDVFDGNTIYNLLKSHKAKVTVYVDGLAASIASVIAMAGDKIIMAENAMMMIHDPWTIAVGGADDMRKSAGVMDKIKGTLITAYAAKSGLNETEIATIMADETWYTAEEAVAMGFADEVGAEVKVDAKVFDLSKFKNTPQAILAMHAGAAPPTVEPIVAPPQKEPQMNAIAPADQKFANPAFRRQVLSDAVAASYAPALKVHEAAAQFRGAGLVEAAYQALALAGVKDIPNRADRDALFRAAMHSTSDFPHLMADAANKILLDAYGAASPTYKAFSSERVFKDFKPAKFLRLGDFPDLIQVGESGEVQRGTLTETKEEVTLATYARMLSLGRAMMINDDLGAFGDAARRAGQRVAQFENTLVFTLLLSNPTLATDGLAVFHATHANYTSSGTAVNVISNLSTGRAAIRKQTGLDGVKLNLTPRVLLVGPDNETAADQITRKTTAERTTAVNPFGGALDVVTDANITDYRWMLFASPTEAPVFVHGSLPGQSAPEIVVKQGFDVLGMEMRVVRDFACGAIDYRGAYLNAGAAPKDEPIAT